MSTLTPLNIEQMRRRVAALDARGIATICSPRHVQSVIEDLQRDVRQLVGHIKAIQPDIEHQAENAPIPDTLGNPDEPLSFSALVRGVDPTMRRITVYASSRFQARLACQQAGLIVYELSLLPKEVAR